MLIIIQLFLFIIHCSLKLFQCDSVNPFCIFVEIYKSQVYFKNLLLIFFIGVQLIYKVVLVSAIQKSESAIHIHMSTLLDSIPIQVSTKHRIEFPVLYSRFLLIIFYIQYCVYVNPKLLIYSCARFPFGNHKFVFYICGSIVIVVLILI